MNIPVHSIANVVEYMWKDEKRDYVENYGEDSLPSDNNLNDSKTGHVFEDLLAIQNWLNSVRIEYPLDALDNSIKALHAK
jgi:hypothetical protein